MRKGMKLMKSGLNAFALNDRFDYAKAVRLHSAEEWKMTELSNSS